MKLFKSLLVAPAALGLMSPLATSASEVNLNDISVYSDVDTIEFANSFNEEEVKDNQLVAGGEGLVTGDSYDGGFSETTVMSGSAGFLLSAADGPNGSAEAAMLEYQVGFGLDTSFTGEDNLYIGIETGNAPGGTNAAGTILDWGVANTDALKVADVNYTFPLYGWTVAVGDSMDASATWSSACAVSNTVDALGDCGAGNSTALGGDVSISASTPIGDSWSLGLGVSAYEGTGTDGIFTEEGEDYYGVSLSYLKDTYGVTVAYSATEVGTTDKTYLGFVGSYTPESFPITLSGGYEIGTVENDDDTYQYTLGASYPIADGTLSVTGGTNGSFVGDADDMSDEEEVRAYDVSYSYPINDSTTVTPFVYTIPGAGSEQDKTGFGTIVSFSF